MTKMASSKLFPPPPTSLHVVGPTSASLPTSTSPTSVPRSPSMARPSAADSTAAAAGGMPVKRNPNPKLPSPDDDPAPHRRAPRFLHRRGGGGRRWCPVPIRHGWAAVCYAGAVAVVVVLWVVTGWRVGNSLSGFRLGAGVERSTGIGAGGGAEVGDRLRFVPARVLERYFEDGRLERLRGEHRFGIRRPRLAFVLGRMNKEPFSLLLLTLVKRLKALGYDMNIYAGEDGEAYSLWMQIGCQPIIFDFEGVMAVDWLLYEGVICSSIETKEAVSSLMQEPFSSVPLIWLVMEDVLGKRLSLYAEMNWFTLLDEWRNAFGRANIVVFPDFSLPMMYSMLDTGNFFVISDTLADVLAVQKYILSHSKTLLRKDHGFGDDDLVIIVTGTSLLYDEFPWRHAVILESVGPLLMNLEKTETVEGETFKFIFLDGNTSDGYQNAFKEAVSQLGLPDDSLKHYSADDDINAMFLMADIVIYDSVKDQQSFPSLLARAMSFEKPIIAPDLAIIKRYVVDGVHGLLFEANNPESLTQSFSLLISGMKVSKFASKVAASGKLLVQDMISECLGDYVKIIENVIQFPSETVLPESFHHQHQSWEWSLFRQETVHSFKGFLPNKMSVVDVMETKFAVMHTANNSMEDETNNMVHDSITQMDWVNLREVETVEEHERHELDELEERTERSLGSWDDIYRSAKKAEKIKAESNERDEGELERTGQPLCIYEVYDGRGAWPFLHHGSLYRGISLSSTGRRSTSDDVDAVTRLPLLNDTYYKDLLCEIGGMFAIATGVDSIHKIPWIGFQTWGASGRKVSLTNAAENKLEELVKADALGDVVYFWVRADINIGVNKEIPNVDFWSLCDIRNSGHCKDLFAKAFQLMYNLPLDVEALPPMPNDRGYWSAMSSWIMPTPSFLEFVMFSRMFTDALDKVNYNLSKGSECLLGSSKLEKKSCYCRMLELLVNVWAYHSARRIIYIDPISGAIEEQHPMEQRQRQMWVKYFDFTLLKSMDEDMAEEADDKIGKNEMWLWPLTGEVYWQGVYEREREERYRVKMDKKRKTKEKLLERHKFGYRQKTLG